MPERFETRLRFLGTYGYAEYTFKGTVLVLDAALDVKNGKTTQAETDQMLQEIEKTILENEKNAMGERKFKTLQYLGDNRFKIDQFVKTSYLDDISYFQSDESKLFVEILETGRPDLADIHAEYTIQAFNLDEHMKKKMTELNAVQQGTFILETDCKVLRHNAQRVSRNEKNTLYMWNIKGNANSPATLVLLAPLPKTSVF
jgi:hypothetical protein